MSCRCLWRRESGCGSEPGEGGGLSPTSEDLELLCKDMTNAKAFEKDGYSDWSKWLKENGVRM